jgi:hypothetical protein
MWRCTTGFFAQSEERAAYAAERFQGGLITISSATDVSLTRFCIVFDTASRMYVDWLINWILKKSVADCKARGDVFTLGSALSQSNTVYAG